MTMSWFHSLSPVRSLRASSFFRSPSTMCTMADSLVDGSASSPPYSLIMRITASGKQARCAMATPFSAIESPSSRIPTL